MKCCFGHRMKDRACKNEAFFRVNIENISNEEFKELLKDLVWCYEHKIPSDILIEKENNDSNRKEL